MASTSHAASGSASAERTPAQWFALLAGVVLVLAGLVGFAADGSFEFGTPHQSGELLGLEVNGVHNLVHILTGGLLLSGFAKPRSALAVTTIFAAAYGLVTLIGLIQGDTVLGIIPVNGPDNVLHVALTLVAVLAVVASRAPARQRA